MGPAVNRFEKISWLLMLEQVAAAARARAAELRDDLTADAQAEYAEQGTAPTWRLPDIGTVTLPISAERVVVDDEQVLTGWVTAFHPDEVETLTRVRPAFLTALLAECRGDEGGVVWMREGALVPGLAVRPGGQPQSLSFRPSPDAKRVAAAGAERLVESLEQSIARPIVLAEAPDGAA